MKVKRNKIILDRGTVVVIVQESLSLEELASYEPTKQDKIPQSYIMIGPDEEHLARIDGIEMNLLLSIITLAMAQQGHMQQYGMIPRPQVGF